MNTLPNFMFLSFLHKKPLWFAITIPTVSAIPMVVDFIALCYILLIMFFLDLITGILGSYFEWKKSNSNDLWFFGKGEGFSSRKAKGSIIKALTYIGLPYLIMQFQTILAIKNVKYETFSDSEFELASVCVILFCLIEGFSIFHENLPKCGFNIWDHVKKLIDFYKKVKTEIK